MRIRKLKLPMISERLEKPLPMEASVDLLGLVAICR
jgi:hypothetical protein